MVRTKCNGFHNKTIQYFNGDDPKCIIIWSVEIISTSIGNDKIANEMTAEQKTLTADN